MSYILDALRRAESERGRGAVPGLHTPAPPAGAWSPAPPAARRRGAAIAAAAVLLAGGAAALAWWAATAARAPADAPAGLSGASGPAQSARPEVVAEALPASVPAPAPVLRPAPAAPAAPAPAPAAAPSPARPVPASVPRAQPSVPASHARDGGASARPAPAPAPAAAAQPPSEPADRPAIVALRDLPGGVREQFPALQINGVTYSSNPAYRMAIVNGQVLHEGDAPAQGVVLDGIEPERTVWRFRGYRVAVPSR